MRYNISSVIVINEDESLTGIVTKTDFVAAFLVNGTADNEVSKYMKHKVITVDPKESLFVVQSILAHNKISRMVIEKNKNLLELSHIETFFL